MAEDVSTAAGVGESLSHAGSAGQTGIVGRLHGLNALATEVVHLVRQSVSTTVQATGSVARATGTVVRDMSKCPLQATEGMSTGLMTRTKPLTHGLVLEGREVGGDTRTVVLRAVKGTIAGVAERGADVAAVMDHAVRGGIAATREAGGSIGGSRARGRHGHVARHQCTQPYRGQGGHSGPGGCR